jgi:crotonobetainyl-CoA:carnitine CoA-transferase CaiB-like acyl-CoA transferase
MARLGTFGVYECADGYVAITAGGPQANALFRAAGKPELADDPRFQGVARMRNYRELTAELEEWTRARSVQQVVAALEEAGVPCGAVRSPGEAVGDALALTRGDTVPLLHPRLGAVGDVPVTGVPIHFANAHVGFDRPAPGMGEHNEAIYGDWLGYSPARIAELRAGGVI